MKNTQIKFEYTVLPPHEEPMAPRLIGSAWLIAWTPVMALGALLWPSFCGWFMKKTYERYCSARNLQASLPSEEAQSIHDKLLGAANREQFRFGSTKMDFGQGVAHGTPRMLVKYATILFPFWVWLKFTDCEYAGRIAIPFSYCVTSLISIAETAVRSIGHLF